MRTRLGKQGFTLVEVAVATLVIAMAVLGITMIVTQTIRGNLHNQRTIEATQIAERIIEETVAVLRDDPEALTCPGTTTGTEEGDSGTEYHTILKLTPLVLNLHTGQYSEVADCSGTDLFQVDVTVAWEGGENVHLSTLTSSDPTYEAHPVFDHFIISDADENDPTSQTIGMCAAELPGRVQLDWAIYGAATITLQIGDAEPFEVDFTGTRALDINETTTFTLTATNIAGITVKEERTAIVDAVPLLNAFAYNPNPTLEGVPSTLSWSTTDAQAVFLDDEPVVASGTRSIQPVNGALATLRLVNGACEITQVIDAPLTVEPLEILDFKSDRDTVTEGESVTLGWTYNHALSPAHHTATITNSRDSTSRDVTTTTYQPVTVSGPTTYTLTVTDRAGSVLATRTATVETVPPARIDAFDASPAKVCGAQPINVTWSAVNASKLTLMPMGVDVTGATNHILPIGATQAVYLIAENEAGHQVESDHITITHIPSPNPTFTSDKTNITQGDTLTLSWEVTHAQTVTINNQVVDATGTWTVAPLNTTTYTLTASNEGCESVERQITIAVQPLDITSVTIAPAEVTSGEEAVLTWELNDAFDPNLHRFVVEPGSIDVGSDTSLTITTTEAGQFAYTVVAYDRISGHALTPAAPDYASNDRELTRSNPSTLTVVEKPVIDAFAVEPLFVCGPTPVTISWETRHASSVLINGQALAPAAAGTAQVNITSATPALVLEAQNRLGYAITSSPVPVTYYEIPAGAMTADHDAITAGQTTTLRWDTQHAASVTLDGQVVDPAGTLPINPLTTTTYVLELTNGPDCAPIRIERTIEVHEVNVTSFTADHSDITRGQSTTLRWNVAHLDPTLHHVELHPLGLDVTSLTSQAVTPLPPRERYTLTITERAEPKRELATSDTVTVVVDEAPTVTSFQADPIGICGVGSTNLTWGTAHATRVLLDNVDVPANNPFGTSFEIDGTRTFTLRAENRLAYPDTAQVTVHQAPQPVVTFVIDKARIPEGDTITLTWDAVDADRVTLDGESVPAQGSRTLTPREATTYQLIAATDNAAGSAFTCITPAEVSVQVDPVSIKRFGLTTTAEVTRGDTLTLPWELDGPFTPGIHTLTLDTIPSGGENHSADVTSLTQLAVRPQVDTSYRLTLRGAVGQLLHQSSVNALVLDPPVVTLFTATPQQVCQAGTVTLAWTATGAAAAFLNGEALSTPGGGTTTRTISATEAFELEVRNSLGASTYAYQAVTTRPAPTTSLEADRTSVPLGGEAKITWSAQHADEVLLNGRRVEPAGSLTITPTSAQTFTLEARADGCITSTRELTITPQPVTANDLQASPNAINAGASSTLTWELDGYHPDLHQTILEPLGLEVAGGTQVVAPSETTAYRVSVRLRASPETVLATSNPTTLTVASEPIIDALRVDPAYICTPTQALTLTWATRNATSATLDGQTVPANGTRQVTGTTFTLKASNALGWETQQTAAPLIAPERTITFTADQEQILRGENVTLQWVVTGAHAATLDGQPVPLTGTLVVTPTQTTVYRLETNTPNGASDCRTTHLVTVEVEELQIESLTATPATIPAGGSSTLAWSATSELDPDKHTLTLEPLGADVTTLTEQQVTATDPTSYWLELRDTNNRLLSRSERLTLAIDGKPALTRATVTPAQQCQPGNVTLTWESGNATHVLIDGQQRPAAGSLNQTITTARQFTLTPIDALGNKGNTETLLARVTPQPTLSLTADKTSIPRGETITLAWDAGTAESVTLNGVHVPAQGSRTFRPDTTTTYRLEAATGDCITAQAATVKVQGVHIDAFTADKENVTSGEDVTLTWSLTGFNEAQHTLTLHPTGDQLEHDAEAITLSPTSSTQYVLRITDQAGRVLAERRLPNPIRVHEAPIITGFTADQLLVHGEADVTLRWGTRHASKVTLEGAEVSPRAEGATTRRVTTERTFTLAATNAAGKAVTATVTIKQTALPTASLQASQSRITAGDQATLTWVASGQQVLLNGASVPATGSMTVAPTRTTTYYTLEARDQAGQKATSTVTITVDPVRVESLTADPTRIQEGDEVTLTWQTTNTFDPELHTLTLQPDSQDVTGRTSIVLEANETTTYQLVLTDKSGRELHRTQPGPLVTLEGAGAIASLTATAPTCAANETSVAWVTRGASSVRLNGQTLDANLTRRGAQALTPAPTQVTLEALNATGNIIDTREITLATPSAPTVAQFRANRSAALAGQTATIEWNVTGAHRVTIDGVEVPAQGEATLAVHETTTYTLHAISADGCAVTERLTIEARHVSVEDLQADKATIRPGESVTLTWTYPVAPAAEHQVILEGHGPLTRNGNTYPISQAVNPTATTTYAVAILDPHGRVLARSNTLTIAVQHQPEIVTFDATPIGVCGAGDVLLTWTTRNASKTFLEHSGAQHDVTTAYGTTAVRANPGDELTLTAWTNYGDDTRTITIGGGQRPSISFNVTPAHRTAGQEATITWDVHGVTSVKLNGQRVNASGTLTDASHQTVAYKLEVEADGCDPIVLERVIHTASVHAYALTADRTRITDGDTTTLRWSLSDNLDPNTHKLVLDPTDQDVTNLRALDVTPGQTTTYSLRVTDKAGATLGASPNVTITVEGYPVITSFDATPMQVCGVQDATFTWTTLNASRVLLNGADVSPVGSGSTTRRITQSGEYVLEAINPLGVRVTSEPLVIQQANQPTITFTADKTTIVDGEPVELTWEAKDATSVTLDGQSAATAGKLTVYPRQTTTYALAANNPTAGIPCETTATVNVTVQPVGIQSFTVTPKDVTVGHDYQLAWGLNSRFDQQLHIVQVDGGSDLGTATSLTRAADESRTHTLTLKRRHDNSVIATKTSGVTVHAAPTIDTLSLAPAAICEGGQSTLEWVTRHANTVTLNGQTVAASGTRTLTPGASANYELIATNPAGTSVQRQATLTVNPRPVITFTTTKATMTAGDTATLTWSIQNATSARINGQNVPLTGSMEVDPLETTTYTLSVDQALCGTTSRQVTVNVNDVSIQMLWFDPSAITVGDPTTAYWDLSPTYSPTLHRLELTETHPENRILADTLTGDRFTFTPDPSDLGTGSMAYDLTVYDLAGRTLDRYNADFGIYAEPRIHDLTATPAAICAAPDQTHADVTLHWTWSGNISRSFLNGEERPYGMIWYSPVTHPVSETTTFVLEGRNFPAYWGDSSRGITTAEITVPFTQVIDPTFSASKARITAGDTVTLTWNAIGATTVGLDGQAVSASGSLQVRPTSTTTYTLTAQTGDCAPITKTITITVDPVSVDTFSADKTNVTSGDPVQLTWSLTRYSTSLHKLVLQPLGTTVTGTNTTVHPTVTTNYRLRIDDNHGRALAQGPQLTVTANAAPAIESFTVQPQLVCGPKDVTLTWSTINATALRLNGQALTPISNGSTTRRVTGNTTFTLAALNAAGGSVTEAHTVTYVAPLEASLTSNKSRMVRGDTATLTWSVSGAKNITLDGQTVNATGTRQVTPTQTTTYTVVATSEHCGTITRTVTVEVDPVTITDFRLDDSTQFDEHGSISRDAPDFHWQTTNLNPSLHALELTAPTGVVTDLPGAGTWSDTSGRTFTYVLTIYDLARNIVDRTEIETFVQPLITGTWPATNVCLPAPLEVAWTVHDAQKYTVHQNGQLVANVDRSPNVITELVRRTVNLADDQPVTLTYTATNPLGSTAAQSVTIQGAYPPELTLTSTPAVAGAPVTVTWSIANAPAATTIRLDGQSVPATGSTTYTIGKTTRAHTLTIEGDPCGAYEKTLPVTPALPTIPTFNTNTTTVTVGDTAQFTWSTNAHYDPTHHRLELAAPGQDQPGISDVAYDLGTATSHARTITKAAAHDYRLTIYSRHTGEQLAASAVRRVTGVHPPRIDSFTATPQQVCSTNPTSTLAWAAANATSRTLTGAGSVAATGSRTINLTGAASYTLTAGNAAGTTVTRTVNVAYITAPEITSFTTQGPSANNNYVTAGKTYTLSWSMSDPNAVPILDGVPLAAGTTSATRAAPNSPDPITHTLELELGPCATEPVSLIAHPAIAPSAIPAPVATITAEQEVTLTWNAPASSGNAPITSYGVYRLTNGTNPATVYLTNVNSYVDEGVLPGNTYKYFVWAGNAANLWGPYSPYSNEVTVIGAPGIPGTPTITNASDRSLTIAWAPPTFDGGALITSYRVERQASSDGSAWDAWSTAQSGNNGTTFTDTGLTAGTYYRYRVAATNQAGASPSSSPSVSARALTTPSAPNTPSITPSGDKQLTVTWNTPANDGYSSITGYRLYRTTTSDGLPPVTTTIEINGSPSGPQEYVDSNLLTGAKVTYRVAAMNTIGEGALSAESSQESVLTVPGVPESIIATVFGESGLQIVWQAPVITAVAPLDSYQLQRQTSSNGTSWNSWETIVPDTGNIARTIFDEGLTAGTYYRYRVAGLNQAGVGEYSPPSDETMAINGPEGVTNLRAHVHSDVTHRITWDNPSDDPTAPIDNLHIHFQSLPNLARNATISGSSSTPERVNDGHASIHSSSGIYASFGSGTGTNSGAENSYIQIDLGTSQEIAAVVAYFYGSDTRHYWYKVKVSEDGNNWTYLAGNANTTGWAQSPDSREVTTGDYLPTIAEAPSETITARYVRLYANGSTANSGNHILELEVLGAGTWYSTRNLGGHLGTEDATVELPAAHAGDYIRYRTQVRNSAGWVNSEPTNVNRAATNPGTPVAPVVSLDSDRRLRINLTAPTSGYDIITGYNIQYRTGINDKNWGAWTTLNANTGNHNTSYTHGGLTAGTYYQYRVAAINAAGTGPISATSSALRAATVPSTPSAPRAAATGDRIINVTWSAPSNGYSPITGYTVQRSTNGGAWVQIGTPSTASIIDTGVAAGSTYQYRVLARNALGPGGVSAASTSIRPYYYRNVEYRHRWSGFWCTYTLENRPVVYGNNVWHQEYFTSGGGCAMTATTGTRWNAQLANPTPECTVLNSNQSGAWALGWCRWW